MNPEGEIIPDGINIQTPQWEEQGGIVHHFRWFRPYGFLLDIPLLGTVQIFKSKDGSRLWAERVILL